MKDIVTRLRTWVHAVDAVPASDLMDEAADLIERLRLTDAEREAVETSFDAMQYAADELGLSQAECDRLAATMRGLLERTAR